jgi:hypothetical protein
MRMFADAKGHTVAEALTFALQTERDASFRTISRLPSTEAKRFIRYVSQLTDDRWQILSRTLAKRGSSLLVKCDEKFPYTQIEAAFTDAERHELGAWHRAALTAGGDVDLMPLRLMKMAVGADKSAQSPAQFAGLPKPIRKIDEAQSAQAATLRKLLKSIFGGLGFEPRNIGGGNWVWNRSDDAFACNVSLDFGTRTDQLRYHVHLASKGGGPKLGFLSLEGMLGFGNGHWNIIFEHQAEASVRLLGEIVEDIAGLPRSFRDIADCRLHP